MTGGGLDIAGLIEAWRALTRAQRVALVECAGHRPLPHFAQYPFQAIHPRCAAALSEKGLIVRDVREVSLRGLGVARFSGWKCRPSVAALVPVIRSIPLRHLDETRVIAALTRTRTREGKALPSDGESANVF